jgi:hypothetical protein
MYSNKNKPFCKVCADVGKTDTAHYIRLTPDPKSPVVCPTLLALKCRYCFKSGHTVKYCAVAKKNKRTTTSNNNNFATSIAKANQTDDNYQYYRYCEDYSRSPNLEAYLSEPSVELKQEQLTVGEKYRDRLYEILYEYFKNEFHRERTGKVVDRLLECSSEEELEEFMSNRLYLEDCADEIFTALKQFDPPAKGYTEVDDC